MTSLPNSNIWKTPNKIDSQTVFKESIVNIQLDTLQMGEDEPYPYYSLLTPPRAVAILATTSDGKLIINEEYRHPTGHFLLGCPGGFIDDGETPIQAAERELLEETGYKAESYKILGSAYPYSGFSIQKTIYIRAKNAKLTCDPQRERSEIIHVHLLKLQALNQLIINGNPIDGVLCTALYLNYLDEGLS